MWEIMLLDQHDCCLDFRTGQKAGLLDGHWTVKKKEDKFLALIFPLARSLILSACAS